MREYTSLTDILTSMEPEMMAIIIYPDDVSNARWAAIEYAAKHKGEEPKPDYYDRVHHELVRIVDDRILLKALKVMRCKEIITKDQYYSAKGQAKKNKSNCRAFIYHKDSDIWCDVMKLHELLVNKSKVIVNFLKEHGDVIGEYYE
jgi:hypothetical protein